jgi:hypothetical protein
VGGRENGYRIASQFVTPKNVDFMRPNKDRLYTNTGLSATEYYFPREKEIPFL